MLKQYSAAGPLAQFTVLRLRELVDPDAKVSIFNVGQMMDFHIHLRRSVNTMRSDSFRLCEQFRVSLKNGDEREFPTLVYAGVIEQTLTLRVQRTEEINSWIRNGAKLHLEARRREAVIPDQDVMLSFDSPS